MSACSKTWNKIEIKRKMGKRHLIVIHPDVRLSAVWLLHSPAEHWPIIRELGSAADTLVEGLSILEQVGLQRLAFQVGRLAGTVLKKKKN